MPFNRPSTFSFLNLPRHWARKQIVVIVATKGVDPDTKVGGADCCVNPTFSSWGSGGRCKPPSGVRGRAPEANAFWQKYFAY